MNCSTDSRLTPPSPPDVSVIMSVYNGAEHVEEAIQSILKQTLENFEFIIVDDASTDSTPRQLASLADPRIRVLRNANNQERAFSRNLAVQHASAPLIAFMDADDFAPPQRFKRQVDFMREYPEVTVCAGIMEIYETGEVVRFPMQDSAIRLHLMRHSCLPHSTWMIRREALTAIDGFDHSYIPAEDYDLLGRLSEAPQTCFACLPEVLLKYRVYPKKVRSAYEETQRHNAARVRARFVRVLVPEASADDLACHEFLCGYAGKADAPRLVRCGEWLKRLLAANEAKKIHEQELFRYFWLRQWWELCSESIHPGMLLQIASGRGLKGLPRMRLVRPMRLLFAHWLQRKLLPSRWRIKNMYHRTLQ